MRRFCAPNGRHYLEATRKNILEPLRNSRQRKEHRFNRKGRPISRPEPTALFNDNELHASLNKQRKLSWSRLVRSGRLDEAEQAARDLLVRFPEVHDGYDRLGMVYEARGEIQKAADSYRKVIEFIREQPENYDPGFEDAFVKLVDRLDPPATP